MFRIKICGIRTADDALRAAQAGADAIGLNFFPASPRFVTEAEAGPIVAALPATVAKVGVFVNSPASEVLALAERLRLDFVQIHGEEPPDFLPQIASYPVIRALAARSGLESIFSYLDACRVLGCVPAAVLVDAYQPGQFGGTGHTVDWQALAAARERFGNLPLILAGGLRPDNVAQAIQLVRPAAVDTASGVETAPGHKSAQLVQDFVRGALDAFERSGADRAPPGCGLE